MKTASHSNFTPSPQKNSAPVANSLLLHRLRLVGAVAGAFSLASCGSTPKPEMNDIRNPNSKLSRSLPPHIECVHIQSVELSQEAQNAAASELQQKGWRVTPDADEADAILKLSLSKQSGEIRPTSRGALGTMGDVLLLPFVITRDLSAGLLTGTVTDYSPYGAIVDATAIAEENGTDKLLWSNRERAIVRGYSNQLEKAEAQAEMDAIKKAFAEFPKAE